MKAPISSPSEGSSPVKTRRSLFRFLCALLSFGGALILLAGAGLVAGNIYLSSRYSALTASDVSQLLYAHETPIGWGLMLVLAGGLGWILSARQEQQRTRDS